MKESVGAIDGARLREEIASLARYVVRCSQGDSGIVAVRLDLETGRPFGRTIGGDLGDFSPFLAWTGTALGEEMALDFARRQTDQYVDRLQMPSGLFFTRFSAAHQGRIARTDRHLFDTLDLSDLIVGLNLMRRITGDDRYLDSASRFLDSLYNLRDKDVVNALIAPGWLQVPLAFGQSGGIFIEEAVELACMTGESRYTEMAQSFAVPWLGNKLFQTHHLFPFICSHRWLEPAVDLALKLKTGMRLDTAYMFKQNTNLIYGLLALYRETGDEDVLEHVKLWRDAVIEHLLGDGFFFLGLDLKRGRRLEIVNLNTTTALLDAFLEIYRITGEASLLTTIVEVTNQWLARRAERLVPLGVEPFATSIFEERRLPCNTSRLDPQIDFVIFLLKLAQVEPSFTESADEILDAILVHHRYGEAFAEYVDLDTMRQPRLTIETKFLTLLLKGLLFRYEMSRQHPTDAALVTAMIRDR